MENKIQQLKERIYALNRELKELTMGCILRTKTDNSEYLLKYIGKNNNQHALKVQSTGTLVFVDKIGDTTEIIGHPIHLEHVLRAIIESVGYRTRLEVLIETPPVVTQRKEGIFRSGRYIIKLLEQYDLTKTFDQNIAENEELVAFLLNIIK